MSMRHNKHILLTPVLAKVVLVPFLAYLLYELVKPLLHIVRRLATLAPVAPDVPVGVETALGAQRADLRGCEALVVAVVPFAYEGRYGGGGGGATVLWGRGGGGFPGVAVAAVEVEELEGALGTVAGGDVAGCS
jgi:hypothetical protein